MSEKLRSTDAVEMGIDKHMVASLYRLGNNAISMPLVSNSFSCMDYHLLAAKKLTIRFPLLCWDQKRQWLPSQIQFLPIDLASKSLPNCPMRV